MLKHAGELAVGSLAFPLIIIAAGLTSNYALAADIAVVYAAALAFLFSFSSDAKALVLASNNGETFKKLFTVRLTLSAPLFIFSALLCYFGNGTGLFITLAVLLNRVLDWNAELVLAERARKHKKNNRFYLYELFAVIAVLLSFIFLAHYAVYFIMAWSVFLLVYLIKPLQDIIRNPVREEGTFVKLLPRMNSRSVSGAGLYFFRSLLVVLCGKGAAGELFTAFSLGAITASFYKHIYRQWLKHHGQKTAVAAKRYLLRSTSLFIALPSLTGVLIYTFLTSGAVVTGNLFLWKAIAVSLFGGAFMVKAKYIKTTTVSKSIVADFFMPDLFAGIILISSAFFLYFMFGPQSFIWLYLISGITNYVLYSMHAGAINRLQANTFLTERKTRVLKRITLIIIALPLAFASNIPLSLPVSIVMMFVLGVYQAKISKMLFLLLFCALNISVIFASGAIDGTKYLLFVRGLSTVFAFALGEVFYREKNMRVDFSKIFLFMALALSLEQIINYFVLKLMPLNIGVFIYAPYPLIIVFMFVIAVFNLYKKRGKYKIICFILTVIMAFYCAAVQLVLPLAAFIGAMVMLAAYSGINNRYIVRAVSLAATGIICSVLFFGIVGKLQRQNNTFIRVYEVQNASSYSLPSLSELSPGELLFGFHHDNAQVYSNNSYYLDMAYNFGILTLLVILLLALFTVKQAAAHRKIIAKDAQLFALCFIMFFILFVANCIGPVIKQPYIEVFYFFIWGYFLKRLAVTKTALKHKQDSY